MKGGGGLAPSLIIQKCTSAVFQGLLSRWSWREQFPQKQGNVQIFPQIQGTPSLYVAFPSDVNSAYTVSCEQAILNCIENVPQMHFSIQLDFKLDIFN